jgi:hypothetical protein
LVLAAGSFSKHHALLAKPEPAVRVGISKPRREAVMLISLAVVTVSQDVWISNITDDDVVAFGRPQQTGVGSHLIRLKEAEFRQGLLTFERRDALFIRRGRTPEAVLFRDLARAGAVITDITAIILPDDDVYWVTVGAGRQGNFEIGIRNGVWGVPAEYGDKLREVDSGDKIVFYGKHVGFALCEVKGRMYHDATPVWPDGPYPYRVRITPPLKRNDAEDFGGIFQHLLDRHGQPYPSPQAAGRAIGGQGGVFRRLRRIEVAGLLRGLGWQ